MSWVKPRSLPVAVLSPATTQEKQEGARHNLSQPHTCTNSEHQDPGMTAQASTINYRLPSNHTCAGGSIWISSLVNALLEINQREDIKSNSGALCLLLRLLIDNNILRTLAAIPSHLPRSDKVAGRECAEVCSCVKRKNGRVNQAGCWQEAMSR